MTEKNIKKILAFERPDLIKEWDFKKNDDICAPDEITIGSNKKVWWKCKENHTYLAAINKRVGGSNCPYCSNQKVLKGFNDLATTNPELAKEWHSTKNGNLTSEMVVSGSNKLIWWLGECGHEWRARIFSRNKGKSCPICSKYKHTSFPEQAIYFYVKKVFPKAINGYKDIFPKKMELDIYIPDIKTGIEYDGIAWHTKEINIERDAQKYEICKKHSIKLIRIKEVSEKSFASKENCDDSVQIYMHPSSEELNLTIQRIFELLQITGFQFDFNVDRDNNNIFELYLSNMKGKSLLSQNLELAKEWHPTKNGKITPSNVFANSSMKPWWQCRAGHEWQATVNSRNSGVGCPYCSNRKILKGFNDLATTNPELAKEWHPTKNGNLTPDEVVFGSSKSVFWLCACGHEWRTQIRKRATGNTGCPICANKKVLKGFNDLATTNPELTKEWHPTKNGNLTPEMVSAGTKKKVWWLGECGHEWESTISNRNSGTKCPYCLGRLAITGETDLASINPMLAKEWHSTRNGTLTPEMVRPHSGKKVWWIGECGHEWEATIAKRESGSGCPFCARAKHYKSVKCIETNTIYHSINEAATKHGFSASNLHKCLSGKTSLAGGYHWEYIDQGKDK